MMKPIKFHPFKILVPLKNAKFHVYSHCTIPEARGPPKNKKKQEKSKNVKFLKVFQGNGGGIAGGWLGVGWGLMGGAGGRPGALIFNDF